MFVRNSVLLFLTDKNDRFKQPSGQNGCGIAIIAEKEDILVYIIAHVMFVLLREIIFEI